MRDFVVKIAHDPGIMLQIRNILKKLLAVSNVFFELLNSLMLHEKKVNAMQTKDTMTPLERVEALFEDLVAHYGEGEDREIRAAAKILLVGLEKMKTYGGDNWAGLLDEYVSMLKNDPEKFQRVLQGNRGHDDRILVA